MFLSGNLYIHDVVKIAIVGSRSYANPSEVSDYVKSLPEGTIIVTGGADGVDSWAESAARTRGFEVIIYPADWRKYGRGAGHIRNRQIVETCDKLVAFWDEVSPGTRSSISIASKAKKLEKVFRCGNPNQGSLF